MIKEQQTFQTRIPTMYFITSGAGESNEGIAPDYYQTFSHDIALLEAGIENFNHIYYTSVIPPEAHKVSLYYAKKYFHHGAVLESITAKAKGIQGDTVTAGVGIAHAKNKNEEIIGGYAAEYEFNYKKREVSIEEATKNAKKQLSKSLTGILERRELTFSGNIDFEIKVFTIKKNYGMAISTIGFLNYIFPPAVPK